MQLFSRAFLTVKKKLYKRSAKLIMRIRTQCSRFVYITN